MSPNLFSGTGPGPQTSDGCSVEVYRRIPYRGELEPIRGQFRPGVSVLELGCGTGRMTGALLSYGCVVTAVDNSPDMLSFVPNAARVIQSPIEELNLAEEFDVVLLAAGLINHCEGGVRSAFIGTAAVHTSRSGRFIVERQDPAWLASARVGTTRSGPGVAVSVESVSRIGRTVGMTVKYVESSDSWTHSFVLEALEDGAFEKELNAGGFGHMEWLDARRCWASASLEAVA